MAWTWPYINKNSNKHVLHMVKKYPFSRRASTNSMQVQEIGMMKATRASLGSARAIYVWFRILKLNRSLEPRNTSPFWLPRKVYTFIFWKTIDIWTGKARVSNYKFRFSGGIADISTRRSEVQALTFVIITNNY